ncbi:MAG: hypothetical protein ACPIOQ_72535 [Promethearchaeia archaeon]
MRAKESMSMRAPRKGERGHPKDSGNRRRDKTAGAGGAGIIWYMAPPVVQTTERRVSVAGASCTQARAPSPKQGGRLETDPTIPVMLTY